MDKFLKHSLTNESEGEIKYTNSLSMIKESEFIITKINPPTKINSRAIWFHCWTLTLKRLLVPTKSTKHFWK